MTRLAFPEPAATTLGGCEGFYVCQGCSDTPADPLYVDLEPREPLPEPERDEYQIHGGWLGFWSGHAS